MLVDEINQQVKEEDPVSPQTSFNISQEQTAREVQKGDNAVARRPVCPNTRHLLLSSDETGGDETIQAAYKDLEEFHNAGGNLKVIEKYLNQNIDETLRLLNVTFTPQGSNRPLPLRASISQTVQKLLIQNDRNKRRGYDQREMPGLFVPVDHKALRGRRKGRKHFDVIEPTASFSRWKHGLGPIPNLCKHLNVIKPVGETKDQVFEEKFMCHSTPFDKNNTENNNDKKKDDSTNPVSSSCEMISIGSNGEWGFENNVVASMDCIVHTFDCTVLNPSKPSTDSIHFYPYCIAAEYNKIGQQEFITYSQMVEKASLSRPPSLLKMDVEGFEFDVFTQMLKDAQEKNLKHLLPQQISVELHYGTRMYDLPWHMRLRQAGEIALFAGMMYRQGGYVLVHVKYIRGCDPCAEVLFVRVFCD
jgi:hypothetical protein